MLHVGCWMFSPQDLVYAKKMGRRSKWVLTIIIEMSGPLSYKVTTNVGSADKVACGSATANASPHAVEEGKDQSTQDSMGEVRGSQELRPPSPVEEAEFRGFAPSLPTHRGQTSSSQCLSGKSSEAKSLASTRPTRESSKPNWRKDFVM
ncbi:hypothetical protein PR048_030445 [Dryococelus australis]|uniref:Uncharacterized protein n=1 Tax=Dryococelus australis TaxID=614101 RepID=A0ABQ9GCV2_9NEOP|nr:hypothetical protein PR048_030445 [Dryococelus australis]